MKHSLSGRLHLPVATGVMDTAGFISFWFVKAGTSITKGLKGFGGRKASKSLANSPNVAGYGSMMDPASV